MRPESVREIEYQRDQAKAERDKLYARIAGLEEQVQDLKADLRERDAEIAQLQGGLAHVGSVPDGDDDLWEVQDLTRQRDKARRKLREARRQVRALLRVLAVMGEVGK